MKLTVAMDVPLSEVKAAGELKQKSLDARLAELSERYGLTQEKPHPTPKDDFKMAIAFSLKWEGGRNFDIVDGAPVLKPYERHGGPDGVRAPGAPGHPCGFDRSAGLGHFAESAQGRFADADVKRGPPGPRYF